MSLFGKLDAANVKANPNHVEAGDYLATITDARINTSQDGRRQLIFVYTIDDENSMFLDKKVSKFYFLPDPDLTEEGLLLLPKSDQEKIIKNITTMKRDLCGNPVNKRQKGLGVDPEDLNNEEWDPKSLMGTKVVIHVTNYGPTNEGVGVQWVNLAE